MREILRFKDNDIEYFLFYMEDKLVPAKRIKQKLSYDLTKEEISLIKEIFSRVLPTNNVIYLGKLPKFNKLFNHYYDYINHYHIFTENGKIINIFDFIKLNYLYNNELEYKTLQDDLDKQAKIAKIKRILLIGTKSIIVILATYELYFIVNFGPSIYQNFKSYLANPILNGMEEILDLAYDDLTAVDVINYLNSNPHLNQAEKEYLTSFLAFFVDELPYVDRRDLIDNLKNMNTQYFPEKNGLLRGAWFSSGEDIYQIKIWESKSNDYFLADEDKYVLRHEFFHTWSKKRNYNLEIGKYFYEFLNHILANEYGNVTPDSIEYDKGYLDMENYGRIFLELIDDEAVLREYHVTNDANILIKELLKIENNEELAYQLISRFDDYFLARKECQASYEETEEKQAANAEALQAIETDLKNKLTYYWEKKFAQKITDDIYVSYLLEPEKTTLKLKEIFSDYQILQVLPDKAYFNKRLNTSKRLRIQVYKEKSEEFIINESAELIDDLKNNRGR